MFFVLHKVPSFVKLIYFIFHLFEIIFLLLFSHLQSFMSCEDTPKDEDWADCRATNSDETSKDPSGNSASTKSENADALLNAYDKRTPIATLIIEKSNAEATIEETFLSKPALFWNVEGLSQVAHASCKSEPDKFKLVYRPNAETTFVKRADHVVPIYNTLTVGCFGWIGGGNDDIVQCVRGVIDDAALENIFTELSKYIVAQDLEVRALLPSRTKDLLSGDECTDYADQKHVYKAHFVIKEPEFVTNEIQKHKHTDLYFNVVDRAVPVEDIAVTIGTLNLTLGRQRRLLYQSFPKTENCDLGLKTFGWFGDLGHWKPECLDAFLVDFSGKEEDILAAFEQLIIKLLETPHTKPKHSLPPLEYVDSAGDSIVVHWYQSREPGKILDRVVL